MSAVKDYFLIAFGDLKKRFLRTSLTMLGIFIGIAAVVALISLGQGMRDVINQQIGSFGYDKIMVQGASAGFGPPGANTAGAVGDHDLNVIENVPGVQIAGGRLLKGVNVEFADTLKTLFTVTLPDGQARDLIIDANNYKVLSGRMLKSSDSKKVLVGYNLWSKDVFDKRVSLDSKLLVNGVAFQVVGLLDKAGMNNDAVIMNEKDARDLLSIPDGFSMIVAQVSSGSVPSEVGARVSRALRRDRGQKEGFEDFTVQTSEELIKSVNTILGVVQAIFVGIAAISLLVGGIGIMNTMYTSVLERTHDIGIMKAIGARNGAIMSIFLLESGLLGLAGGVVGVLLGVGLSKTVEYFGSQSVGVLQASFSWYLIVGALAFSFFVGIFSGVFPARQAAKLPPVEALRQ